MHERKSERGEKLEAVGMSGLFRMCTSRARKSKIAQQEGTMTNRTFEKVTVKSKKRQLETGVNTPSLQMCMADREKWGSLCSEASPV